MTYNDWQRLGKQVFESEINAALMMKECIDDSFSIVCDAIDACAGTVLFTGMGKSGHICKKIVATMQSLGIRSQFLHPAEALHGDIGMVNDKDIIIAVSKSGESSEVLALYPTIRKLKTPIYSILANPNSSLAKISKASITIPCYREAFLDDIVPSSSTTVTLMIGDALAIAVASNRGFSKSDFGYLHPNGLLGKRLTMIVNDIMLTGEENAIVKEGTTVEQAIFEMCRKPIGGVNVTDSNNKLLGVLTEGDLRRLYQQYNGSMGKLLIEEVMNKAPAYIESNILLADAIKAIQSYPRFFSYYPVVKDGELVGAVRFYDISCSGLL